MARVGTILTCCGSVPAGIQPLTFAHFFKTDTREGIFRIFFLIVCCLIKTLTNIR